MALQLVTGPYMRHVTWWRLFVLRTGPYDMLDLQFLHDGSRVCYDTTRPPCGVYPMKRKSVLLPGQQLEVSGFLGMRVSRA